MSRRVISRKSRVFWASAFLTVVFGGTAIVLFFSQKPGGVFYSFAMIVFLMISIHDCRTAEPVSVTDTTI